jgi:hypothetical protein
MGGFGILGGQGIREIAFLSSALQSRELQEEILGGWEVPMHPEVEAARPSFLSLVGDFDWRLLDSPDFYRRGPRGQAWPRPCQDSTRVPSSPPGPSEIDGGGYVLISPAGPQLAACVAGASDRSINAGCRFFLQT